MINRCWHIINKNEIQTTNGKLFLIKCDRCERGFVTEIKLGHPGAIPKLPDGWVSEVVGVIPGDTLHDRIAHYCMTCALLK